MTARAAGRFSVDTTSIEAPSAKPSAEALKARFRDQLIERSVEVCGMDEAVHAFTTSESLTPAKRKAALVSQANRIKSLVNKTPTTIVLVGAYDFFELTVGTAQLARRSQIVHLEPYSSSQQDLLGFLISFKGLLTQLPTEHSIDPSAHATEVFLQSLGCVGNLKKILSDALKKALRRNSPVTMDILRASYFSAPALHQMKVEQQEGVSSLKGFLSLDDLAEEWLPEDASSRRRKLKPGETKPSHRRSAAKHWE